VAKRGRGVRDGRRVVGYARVSTDQQAAKGVSLETQVEKIRQYCTLHDLELVELKVETKGAKAVRPVLEAALDMIESGEVDGLVVWNLDRFARSVKDVSTMIEKYFAESGMGARLISVTESIDTHTAGGRLVVNVLASVHQWEAERLRERIRANLDRLAEQGYWAGGNVPFGYRAKPREYTQDGNRLPRRLESNPQEQEAIAAAQRLKGDGLSLREIAVELSRLRFRPRTGGSFSAQQVSNMLDVKRQARLRPAAS
jgi:DNA invertase Pin-like site-specific DNA recombinase